MTPTNSTKPRAYTADEVRDMLLDQIRAIANYWATTELDPEHDTIKRRCEGVAFTILSTLDGSGAVLPGFDLIPTPHPEDKDFHKANGENWFSPKTRLNYALHEYFYRKERS